MSGVKTYAQNPVLVQAIQYTEENFKEVQEFCSAHKVAEYNPDFDDERDEEDYDPKNPEANWYYREYHQFTFREFDGKIQLWCEHDIAWVEIEKGEWILKNKLGYYPCAEDLFHINYVEYNVEV